MKEIEFVANYVVADTAHYLPGMRGSFADELAAALIAGGQAKDPHAKPPVAPPTPEAVEEAKLGDALKRMVAEDESQSLACPFGCRDGKPYATKAAFEAHIGTKHKDEIK